MATTLFKSIGYILAALLIFVACTQDTGTSPYDPSKTKITLLVKSFNKKVQSDIAIKDTIGDSVYYGFNTNLPVNVDSG